MKIIAFASLATAAVLAAVPAQAMPRIAAPVADTAIESHVYDASTRVTRRSTSSAGSSSCLLCTGLGVGLGQLLGLNLDLGIAQSQSFATQSNSFKYSGPSRNNSKGHGKRH